MASQARKVAAVVAGWQAEAEARGAGHLVTTRLAVDPDDVADRDLRQCERYGRALLRGHLGIVGRPRRTTGVASERIVVRVTPDELAAVRAAAAESGHDWPTFVRRRLGL